MSRKLLMALDPGKLTGFVVLDYTDADEDTAPTILYAAEPEQYETCETVDRMFQGGSVDLPQDYTLDVVMERFKITTETGKKNDVDYSLEIIGTVKYLAQKYGFTYTMQTPSQAMNFVDNDRIRNVGLWVKGGAGHKLDAMRHAIYYLVFQKGWRPRGLVG